MALLIVFGFQFSRGQVLGAMVEIELINHCK